ncbi:transcription antitermination factor NusB [Taurinivorans muris]|uniref:Transcription antitermination protein NusB n=1 Tax=Taurinivorans muris TaxID=2787751 RepID=A0ABY5Y2A9_9BACT|nr:transcription antitermination factor NusB [Desulfovibrionaceae bacterium LT0009]
MQTTKSVPRRLSRIKAFQFLYGLEFAEIQDVQRLENNYKNFPTQEGDEENICEGFTWELILGVWQNSKELDFIVQQYSKKWRLDRVGKVELCLLRLALFEMKFRDDIPDKVAINEALELNKIFGEERSQAFINGILDNYSKSKNENK